jgi:arylsulfatase A-like enzyme
MKWVITLAIVICAIGAVLLVMRQVTVPKDIAMIRTVQKLLKKKPPCPDCNILLVNIDTLRAPEMPCYGYQRDTTPNLCRYAAGNQRFTNFYTQTPFTLDSHMSIFTGLYPSTHHVIEALKDSLNPKIPILAETLRNNGYQTVWAGITDDINLPLDLGMGRGFDEFYQMDGNDDTWSQQYEKLLPKFLGKTPTFMFLHTYGVHSPYLVGRGPYKFLSQVHPDIPVTKKEFYATSREYYAFVLAEFVDRLRSSNTPESKERNEAIVKKLREALGRNDLAKAEEITWSFPSYENYSLYMSWYYLQIKKQDPQMLDYLKTLYDERIYQVDQQLIPLLTFLNRPEVKKRTIVIFLSDNGEEFMEHGFLDHGWNIYNTATHTPLIFAVPGMQQAVHHELVQAIDIVPTLLDIVGIFPEGPLEGQSLLPLMEGKGLSYVGDRYLIGQYSGSDIVSIRNSRWKMYKNTRPKEYVELYDLMTDPLEQHNVLGEHLEVARLLDAALTRELGRAPRYEPVSAEFPRWLDENKRNSLRNAGYF